LQSSLSIWGLFRCPVKNVVDRMNRMNRMNGYKENLFYPEHPVILSNLLIRFNVYWMTTV